MDTESKPDPRIEEGMKRLFHDAGLDRDGTDEDVFASLAANPWHPGPARVLDYLQHKMSADDRRQFEAHAAGCRLCTRQLADLGQDLPAGGEHEPRRRWAAVIPWVCAGVAAAAAVLFAALWWWQVGKVSETPTVPMAVAKPSVVNMGFSVQPLPERSGTGLQVVYDRQGFHFQPQVATQRRYGWLYQIDSRGTYLLQPLTRRPDGILAGSYQDQFDDNPGVEYFLIILGDEDLPELNAADGPASWLGADERARLQDLGKQEADGAEAARIILAALCRLGWTGTEDDVLIQRLMHQPR